MIKISTATLLNNLAKPENNIGSRYLSIGYRCFFVQKPVPLGKRVREARKAAAESQQSLAEKVGIKQSSLSDIEADRSKPRESTLLALARTLNSDFGEEWIRNRLASTSDWEKLIAPTLWAIQSQEPILYVFVARLAEANDTFRDMLKPEELSRAKKIRNELVHMLHVEVPPEEQRRRNELVRGIKAGIEKGVQDLGTIDEFLAASVEKYDNALLVLRDWYARDNVAIELPQTLDFHGWETFTLEKKVQEIKAAREIMDHNRYFQERQREASHRTKRS